MLRARFTETGSVLVTSCLVIIAGCWEHCETPASTVETPVQQATLSAFWSSPQNVRMTILVAEQPYRIADSALNFVVDVLTNQIGLQVDVVDGGDTGLPAEGVLDDDAVIQAGRALAPAGSVPTLIIVEVSDTDATYATYGLIDYENTPRALAVMVVHRDPARANAVGPLTPEVIESLTVLHEVGHWFEIPGRDHHLSSVDYGHCSNPRCVMYSGSRVNPCVILSNLVTGPPLQFGPECAEELAEMRARRE
jgi:hypothetical protein